MRKISKLCLVIGLLAALTACGEASPTGGLAQDINLGGSSGNAGKDDGKESSEKGTEQSSEASEQGKQEEEGVFGFLYEGVTLVPGEAFDASSLPAYKEVSQVPSCAFEGNDNVYNYEAFELTAYLNESGEYIYAVYFIDPNLSTTEGLHLGDTVDDMKGLYGENYKAEGNAYTYTRGDTLLSVITNNDVIVSIEYRLDR